MKITEHTVPAEIIATQPELRESTENFSLILDKAVAKTQEDALTYERDLLKRGQQAEQEAYATLPFIPQQIMDIQASVVSSAQATPTSSENNIVSAGLVTPQSDQNDAALQPVTQQVFQQLTKVFDKPGFTIQPGMELRSLVQKQRQLIPVIPFDQLYSELVKQAKTMRQGSTLRLKLALEPDKLGVIDVYMVLDDKHQLAIMFAAQAETRQLLEKSEQDLAQRLAQTGYSLNDMQFMNFSGSGHQNWDAEFTKTDLENTHNDAEMLNIFGQTDIINSVNMHLASTVVNYVA